MAMYNNDPIRVQNPYNPQQGGFPSLSRNPMAASIMAGDGQTQMPQQPKAWGKGGKAWQIIGVIGDALQKAGGGEGTFMPAFLDMQEQTRKERETQQKLAAQAAAISGLGLTLPQQAAVQAGVANYSDFKPSNAQPYRWEDNAGNQWTLGPDGQPTPFFIDKTDKFYVQGDRAIKIANPYAEGGASSQSSTLPTVSDAAGYNALKPGQQYYDPNGVLRTKGGAASNGGGNFPGR